MLISLFRGRSCEFLQEQQSCKTHLLFGVVNHEEEGAPEEDEREEASPIKGPSKSEWDDHMRTHIPFRKWCPFCVKFNCKSEAHARTHTTPEELECEVPMISCDYVDPKSAEEHEQKLVCCQS